MKIFGGKLLVYHCGQWNIYDFHSLVFEWKFDVNENKTAEKITVCVRSIKLFIDFAIDY